MNNNMSTLVLWMSFLLLFLLGSGCKKIDDITQTLRDTNEILEDALVNLGGNAENFEQIVQDAIDEIEDQEVKRQLDAILDNAIVKVSAEVKCNIQFTVDFLKAEIRGIIADLLEKPRPIKEPRVCTLSPVAIDMNLPPNLRNSVCLSGYFLNEEFENYKLYLENEYGSRINVTGSLSANGNSGFKLFINLGGNGVPINNTSKRLVLEWKGDLISTVEIIQKEPEKCELRERSLTGLPKLILYPVHKVNPWSNTLGDKEFHGNGPCTRGWVSVYTRNNGTELWAKSFVQMWECPDDFGLTNEDYTYGDITKDVKLTTVDAGWRIKVIKGTTRDDFQNIDNNHNLSETISGGGPVNSYYIIGDTGGNDLGESRVEVSFKAIKVTLEEIGDCIPN